MRFSLPLILLCFLVIILIISDFIFLPVLILQTQNFTNIILYIILITILSFGLYHIKSYLKKHYHNIQHTQTSPRNAEDTLSHNYDVATQSHKIMFTFMANSIRYTVQIVFWVILFTTAVYINTCIFARE